MDKKKKDRRRKKLLTFPISAVCLLIFLFLGFCFNLWHPGWVVFLAIPFYDIFVTYIFEDYDDEDDKDSKDKK